MPDTSPTLHLGKYIIHEELGRGGFGTVYRATDTTLDRVVALKILDPLLTRDPGFLERFRREAIGAARLEHPNIVPVHEVGESEGRSFIAMKYLPGPSLDGLLAEDLLPVERTLHILAQVAAAVDFAHSKGLIHRDIKPSNIMVAPDDASGDPDHATLTDFGLARASDQSMLTSLGQVLGTPAYMAPEQLDVDRLDEVGPASDVYSFAVVAYEMLAGRPPFVGPTPAVMVAHMAKEPPPLMQFNAEVPVGCWEALKTGLAKNITERPQSAGAIIKSLQAATATVAQAEADRTAPMRGRLSPIWAVAAVLAILSIILLLIRPWEPGRERIAGSPHILPITSSQTIPRATDTSALTAAPSFTLTAIWPATPSVAPGFTPPPTDTTTLTPTHTGTPDDTTTLASTRTGTPTPTATSEATRTATSTPSPTPPPSVVVGSNTINIRSGPGLAYDTLGSAANQTYAVTGRSPDGAWWQINYKGRSAWINAALVTAQGTSSVPVVSSIPPTPMRAPATAPAATANTAAVAAPDRPYSFRLSRLWIGQDCRMWIATAPAVGIIPGATVDLYKAETEALAWRGEIATGSTCYESGFCFPKGVNGVYSILLAPKSPDRYYFKVSWVDPSLGPVDLAPTTSPDVQSDGIVVIDSERHCNLEQ